MIEFKKKLHQVYFSQTRFILLYKFIRYGRDFLVGLLNTAEYNGFNKDDRSLRDGVVTALSATRKHSIQKPAMRRVAYLKLRILKFFCIGLLFITGINDYDITFS